MPKPQLCWECRRKRALRGLANARAKGKLIGRKKERDSDLIRKLIKSGLTYRASSLIAKCSHGAISAEVAAMKREEAEAKRRLAEEAEDRRKLQELGELPEIQAAKS